MRRMRRQNVESWEPEAADAGERLRQACALLAEQEEAFYAGSAQDEEFFASLHAADATRGSVLDWWQEWDARTAKLKTSRSVALSVFRACLPPLLGAVELHSQSLAILATSPDLVTGDGDLATRGVGTAKHVSSLALQLLSEAKTLRAIDRAAVDATLKQLETRSNLMLALVEPIASRVRELTGDGGN